MQYLLPLSWALPAACAILAVAAFGLLLPAKRQQRRVILIGTGLALALGWTWLYVRQVQAPMEALAQTEAHAEMIICSYPTATRHGARATVKLNSLTYGKAVYYGDFSLLGLKPGQSLEAPVFFETSSRIKDEDVTTFTSKGIYLLAYQRDTPAYGPGTSASLRWLPLRTAHAMQKQLDNLFSGDAAAFLKAILTGDRTTLSDQASADLSEAGLSHILAVSGMHCGFLLALLTLFIGKQHRRILAGCAIPVLLFYAALTGGSLSVLRACTMLSLFVLAPLANRENDGWTSLSFALLLILLQNPFAAASVSLQLSFGAMAGILLISPRLYSLLCGSKKHGKVFYFISAGFSTTIGAMACTVPLCGIYFNTLSLISPVSNLLCLWAASLIFMLGMISLILSFLCFPAAKLLALLPAFLSEFVLRAAHLLALLPYHAVYFNNPYLKLWLGFAYLLFAVVFISKNKTRRTYLTAAALSVITLAVTISIGAKRYCADLDGIVLDVGQGQSVLLSSQGSFALLDCGSAQPWKNPGKLAAEQLATMGCRKLDYLLLTHYDYDHVSGVSALLSRLSADVLLVPAGTDDAGLRDTVLNTAALHGVPVREITSLETLPLGDAQLTVFPPLSDASDNDRGLSCLATVGTQDLLVTGDMGSAAEKRLISSYILPDIEVLVVGHHGSKSSSCKEFLDATAPEIACISAGRRNPFGHPAEETLRRLAKHGCMIYRTDLHGDIHFTLNQGAHHGI